MRLLDEQIENEKIKIREMEQINSMLDNELVEMSTDDIYRQYAYFLPEDIELAISESND